LNIGAHKKKTAQNSCARSAFINSHKKRDLILRAREEKSLEARAKEVSSPDVARKSARISSRACEKDAIRFFV